MKCCCSSTCVCVCVLFVLNYCDSNNKNEIDLILYFVFFLKKKDVHNPKQIKIFICVLVCLDFYLSFLVCAVKYCFKMKEIVYLFLARKKKICFLINLFWGGIESERKGK